MSSRFFTDDRDRNFERPVDVHPQPLLAQTLDTVAWQGSWAFYRGHATEQMTAPLRASDSILDLDDFAPFEPDYVSQISSPIAAIASGNAPSGQRLPVMTMAQILEGFPLAEWRPELDGMARSIGVGMVYCKDEGGRLGLGSFKALGGAYAVLRLLQARIARRARRTATSAQITRGDLRDVPLSITVTCATDGNHGCSVSWAAGLFGCGCVIHVHRAVSEGRRAVIARYGAEGRVMPGNYDDAVCKSASDAEGNGWFAVSDTSLPRLYHRPARRDAGIRDLGGG